MYLYLKSLLDIVLLSVSTHIRLLPFLSLPAEEEKKDTLSQQFEAAIWAARHHPFKQDATVTAHTYIGQPVNRIAIVVAPR